MSNNPLGFIGEVLFGNGKTPEASSPYEKKLSPVERGRSVVMNHAVDNLEKVVSDTVVVAPQAIKYTVESVGLTPNSSVVETNINTTVVNTAEEVVTTSDMSDLEQARIRVSGIFEQNEVGQQANVINYIDYISDEG